MAGISTRIAKETERLAKDPPPGIVASPTPENSRFQLLVLGVRVRMKR